MPGSLTLQLARSDADIQACFPVMSQLRPHLAAGEFAARVRRQMEQGYRLLSGSDERPGSDNRRVVAVAGFRLTEMLAWGKALYVDDLITDASERSKGYGEQLMQWLVAHAREAGCGELHLDSGVQRFDAHRFYLAQRMKISSHHFALDLGQVNTS
jgi:GNAT superfamily N-acetyltransferase